MNKNAINVTLDESEVHYIVAALAGLAVQMEKPDAGPFSPEICSSIRELFDHAEEARITVKYRQLPPSNH